MGAYRCWPVPFPLGFIFQGTLKRVLLVRGLESPIRAILWPASSATIMPPAGWTAIPDASEFTLEGKSPRIVTVLSCAIWASCRSDPAGSWRLLTKRLLVAKFAATASPPLRGGVETPVARTLIEEAVGAGPPVVPRISNLERPSGNSV